MGKPSPPPAPDYRGAAIASADASREVATQQNYANRPEQRGPFGSVTWDTSSATDPSTGDPYTQWTQTTNLRPELESALDSQVAQQEFRQGLGEELLGRMRENLADLPQFPDSGGLGRARDDAESLSYNFQTSRLDPQWQDRASDLDIRLRNQGLRPGDEAYDRATRNLDFARTDAYAAARAQAQTEGRNEAELAARLRQQQNAEMLQERLIPINEVNALASGQQVGLPSLPSFQSASRAQPTDFLGAAQAQYGADIDAFNINQANRQATMQGIFGLGKAAAGFV